MDDDEWFEGIDEADIESLFPPEASTSGASTSKAPANVSMDRALARMNALNAPKAHNTGDAPDAKPLQPLKRVQNVPYIIRPPKNRASQASSQDTSRRRDDLLDSPSNNPQAAARLQELEDLVSLQRGEIAVVRRRLQQAENKELLLRREYDEHAAKQASISREQHEKAIQDIRELTEKLRKAQTEARMQQAESVMASIHRSGTKLMQRSAANGAGAGAGAAANNGMHLMTPVPSAPKMQKMTPEPTGSASFFANSFAERDDDVPRISQSDEREVDEFFQDPGIGAAVPKPPDSLLSVVLYLCVLHGDTLRPAWLVIVQQGDAYAYSVRGLVEAVHDFGLPPAIKAAKLTPFLAELVSMSVHNDSALLASVCLVHALLLESESFAASFGNYLCTHGDLWLLVLRTAADAHNFPVLKMLFLILEHLLVAGVDRLLDRTHIVTGLCELALHEDSVVAQLAAEHVNAVFHLDPDIPKDSLTAVLDTLGAGLGDPSRSKEYQGCIVSALLAILPEPDVSFLASTRCVIPNVVRLLYADVVSVFYSYFGEASRLPATLDMCVLLLHSIVSTEDGAETLTRLVNEARCLDHFNSAVAMLAYAPCDGTATALAKLQRYAQDIFFASATLDTDDMDKVWNLQLEDDFDDMSVEYDDDFRSDE